MMRQAHRRQLVLVGILAAAVLGGCAKADHGAYKTPDPFVVEKIEGSELLRLRLEPKAVQRAAIKTEKVAGLVRFGAVADGRKIPYPALLYQPDGSTFVYTNPEKNTYIRHQVTVDYVEGEVAVLSDGPEEGTAVVTDGAAELMGIEFGVGK
jgi:hypothetical protein